MWAAAGAADLELFPTGVGMNRSLLAYNPLLGCVPYVRGDEPRSVEQLRGVEGCSLHAWG